jgi:hypothetical protein
MCIDNAADTRLSGAKKVESLPYIARAKVKGREQCQVVVMHPAGIDCQGGIHRASTKKHHSSTTPHSGESVLPPIHLTSALNHQVRTMPMIESTDCFLHPGTPHVNNAIGAELPRPFQTLLSASRNDYLA